jgi:hypothetical protein
MKITQFQTLLDRFGSDFGTWPPAEAERARRLLATSQDARRRHDTLTGIESWLDASRPRVDQHQARALVRQTLAEIARIGGRPVFLDRLRAAFASPLPRAAFALCLTAIGFAFGLAVGNPRADVSANVQGGPLMIAIADDVLF